MNAAEVGQVKTYLEKTMSYVANLIIILQS